MEHERRFLLALRAEQWTEARRWARHFAVSCIGESEDGDDLVARVLDGGPHDLRVAMNLVRRFGATAYDADLSEKEMA